MMDDSYMKNIINKAIRDEINKVIEVEAEACHKRVVDGIRDKLGKIVMSVSKQYSVYESHDKIVIEVKNDIK